MTDLLTREEFIEGEGNRCPFCGEVDSADFGSLTVDADRVFQECRCGQCDAAWDNAYKIDNAVLQYGPGYVLWQGSCVLDSEDPASGGKREYAHECYGETLAFAGDQGWNEEQVAAFMVSEAGYANIEDMSDRERASIDDALEESAIEYLREHEWTVTGYDDEGGE